MASAIPSGEQLIFSVFMVKLFPQPADAAEIKHDYGNEAKNAKKDSRFGIACRKTLIGAQGTANGCCKPGEFKYPCQ